jgi:hypothetical protein
MILWKPMLHAEASITELTLKWKVHFLTAEEAFHQGACPPLTKTDLSATIEGSAILFLKVTDRDLMQ